MLVVDDERANLRTFRRAFRRALDVTLAEGPSAALDALEGGTFDVALIDYRMPEMNGLELMQHMMAAQPAMRRILLTGYPGLVEAEDARRTGLCERVIAKPWGKDQLLAMLTEEVPDD